MRGFNKEASCQQPERHSQRDSGLLLGQGDRVGGGRTRGTSPTSSPVRSRKGPATRGSVGSQGGAGTRRHAHSELEPGKHDEPQVMPRAHGAVRAQQTPAARPSAPTAPGLSQPPLPSVPQRGHCRRSSVCVALEEHLQAGQEACPGPRRLGCLREKGAGTWPTSWRERAHSPRVQEAPWGPRAPTGHPVRSPSAPTTSDWGGGPQRSFQASLNPKASFSPLKTRSERGRPPPSCRSSVGATRTPTGPESSFRSLREGARQKATPTVTPSHVLCAQPVPPTRTPSHHAGGTHDLTARHSTVRVTASRPTAATGPRPASLPSALPLTLCRAATTPVPTHGSRCNSLHLPAAQNVHMPHEGFPDPRDPHN